MKLPKRLAAAREAKGLSQVELAKKLGVSAGTVGGWETGDHGISKKRLRKVAELLGMDALELLA